MSLIAEVGRKAPKNRFILAMIYLMLSLMGITMVIPFLITINSSTSNAFDYIRFSPFPKYIWSSQDRFVKCLVPYFNTTRGWSQQFSAYAPEKPSYWNSWNQIGLDTQGVEVFANQYMPQRNQLIAGDYAEFTDSYPLDDCFVYAPQIEVINFLTDYYTNKYKQKNPEEKLSTRELREKSLELLSKDWNIPFTSFYNIAFATEMSAPMDFQSWFPSTNSKVVGYNHFKAAMAAHMFTPGIKDKWFNFLETKEYKGEKKFPIMGANISPELKSLWLEFKKRVAPVSSSIPFALRAAWYSYLNSEDVKALNKGQEIDIDTYNKLTHSNYKNLLSTPFPIPKSFPQEMQILWNKFVNDRYPFRLLTIRVTPEIEQKYQIFVQNTLKSIDVANKMFNTQYTNWADFKLSPKAPLDGKESSKHLLALWKGFVKSLPIEVKELDSSEISFQKFLIKKYSSLEVVNSAYNWNIKHIESAFPPFMEAYAYTFARNENNMTFGPILNNYKIILDFLVFNGNAILVTLLLIIMTIAFTLTINPLAAYALSRFNLRGSSQILIFMLATMAFPAMVSAIPAYLLMRDLGMLNTFWALVLPGAANGMAIFILKGFFDSLPMELFEAATIDGASEMQIFRIIAMPMVKPILAINCLNAFIAAYNGWEWALIICQDKSMWTLAVWMYQVSTWWSASPWIVSAGFVIVSIPTMIVFISCQKMILRGIIVPSMK